MLDAKFSEEQLNAAQKKLNKLCKENGLKPWTIMSENQENCQKLVQAKIDGKNLPVSKHVGR